MAAKPGGGDRFLVMSGFLGWAEGLLSPLSWRYGLRLLARWRVLSAFFLRGGPRPVGRWWPSG